jgi:RNA polymerase sigma factor (sigma-70 family)
MFQLADTRHQAFTILLKKYQQRLYWHIRKMVLNHDDADDLIQDVFIKVWNHLEGFREDAKLYTWLYRIATNESITFLNSKKNKLTISLNEDDDSSYLMDTLQSEQFLDGNNIQIKLQKALLTLPDKQRLVFNMKYFDDLKYEEISEIVGTSVGALKASYHLAVKKIEKYMIVNI